MLEHDNAHEPQNGLQVSKKSAHQTRNRLLLIFGAVIVIAAIGIGFRMRDSWALRDKTKENAVPVVSVISPTTNAATEDIILPGNVQAWHEAPIYARTSGYLKEWKTDIGAKVKAGDLLAEIETPEVDAQLRQAEADLQTAEANNNLAQSTAQRWIAMRKTDSVSKQEADEKISDADAKAAALASAKANRDHLQELETFKNVTAPFDGTITARNTDTGALINAGSGTAAGQELFHIADISHLRVYVQVPQNEAAAIIPGLVAELHFAEHPGKVYKAKLLSTSSAVDATNRTLLAEFEADSTDGELLAGDYAEVHMKLNSDSGALRLPVNTLIFRASGLQVATVGEDNHTQLKTITLGRDFGNEVEVKFGIDADDKVIVNPADSLANDEVVRISKDENKDGKKDENAKPEKTESKDDKK